MNEKMLTVSVGFSCHCPRVLAEPVKTGRLILTLFLPAKQSLNLLTNILSCKTKFIRFRKYYLYYSYLHLLNFLEMNTNNEAELLQLREENKRITEAYLLEKQKNSDLRFKTMVENNAFLKEYGNQEFDGMRVVHRAI